MRSFVVLLCLYSLVHGQESSRQNKAWKFAEESSKEASKEESVREERTIDLLQPSKDERNPKILGGVAKSASNVSAENVEGRFFLKDKLCLLGLADCSQKKAYYGHNGGGGAGVNLGGIQYVQPIKVVPHGQPIAAVPITNPQHHSTHSNYQVPSYNAPKPSYGAPKPSYGAPQPVYKAPKPSYDAPKPVYKAAKPTYNAPKPTYGAPKPVYKAPKPTYNAPKPSYGAPLPTYNAPSIGGVSLSAPPSNFGYQSASSSIDTYGVDRYQGQLTGNIYSNAYQTNFGSAAGKRDDDGHHHNGHHGNQHNGHHGNQHNGHHGNQQNIHHVNQHNGQHGNQHNGHHGGQITGSHSNNHGSSSQFQQGLPQQSTFHVSPNAGGSNRQGRRDDNCFCVPVAQCSSHNIVGSHNSVFSSNPAKQIPNSQRKDYSNLIDPRNKKTIIEAEEDDEPLKKEEDEINVEAKKNDEPKKRAVRQGKSLDDQKETVDASKHEEKASAEEETRSKRDVEEPQDFTDPSFNAGEVLQPRQRVPFGPNGIKPPTCGFPNSGYVCCRVNSGQSGGSQFVGGSTSSSSSSNFNQFSTQKNNRAVGSSSSGGRFSTFNNNVKLTTSTPGQCGKSNSQGINGRITGTNFERKNGESEFGEYPWQVAILKKDTFDNVYLCAGSLIDGSHVITAAHCVRGYNPEELVLRLGEWDVNNDSEFYTHIEVDAKNIFIHENFYPGNLYNDIAVVRLNKYVDFAKNRHISPVCLPDRFHNFAGQRCYVTGWGKDAFLDGNYQHILKEVNVPILDNGRCENLLKRSKLGPDFVLDKGFLCAGGEEGKDACKGDGGGPLVCEVNGLWQLAGIVSWGIGCGEYNVPGIYVKVSEYEDWIQKQLLRTF